MNKIFAAVALIMVPTISIAQVNSESGSQSAAQSHVILEGSNYDRPAPGMGGVGGNSTAPCVISRGWGVVGPGAGIQYTNGRIDDSCLTRTEAAMVKDLLDMPPSQGKQAAIAHACRYSERLRETLVAAGACVIRKK